MLTFKEFLLESEEYPEIKPGVILNNINRTNFYKIVSRNKGTIEVMEISNVKGKPNTSVEYEPAATCSFIKSYKMSGGKWFNCKFIGKEEQLEIWNKRPINKDIYDISNMTIADNIYRSFVLNNPKKSDSELALELLKKHKKKEPANRVTLKFQDGSSISIYRDKVFKDKFQIWIQNPHI